AVPPVGHHDVPALPGDLLIGVHARRRVNAPDLQALAAPALARRRAAHRLRHYSLSPLLRGSRRIRTGTVIYCLPVRANTLRRFAASASRPRSPAPPRGRSSGADAAVVIGQPPAAQLRDGLL